MLNNLSHRYGKHFNVMTHNIPSNHPHTDKKKLLRCKHWKTTTTAIKYNKKHFYKGNIEIHHKSWKFLWIQIVQCLLLLLSLYCYLKSFSVFSKFKILCPKKRNNKKKEFETETHVLFIKYYKHFVGFFYLFYGLRNKKCLQWYFLLKNFC